MSSFIKRCAIVLICLSCVILSSARIIVADTNEEFDSAQLFFANYDLFETFDGEMVLADASNLTGKVVFSPDITTIPVMNIIRDLMRFEPRAIVVSERYSIPGRGMYNWDGQDVSSITLPVIQVSLDVSQQLSTLFNRTQSMNVTISSEGNRWTDVYHSWGLILWRVVVILCGCACIGVAYWKITQFKLWSTSKRCQISVVSVCMTIEIIGNFWRVLYVALDPFGCCNVLTYWGVNTLNSISFPYNVSSFLLVTLYWHECMTRASLDQNPFLKKLKIPFYCLAGGLILLDILFTVLSFFENMRKSVVLVAIYSAILVALLIFYGITAARLLKRLSKTNKLLDTQYRIKKMTITLLIGGGLQFFGLIVTVIFIIDSIMQVPINFVTVWGAFFLLFDGMSMARLLTFQKRAKHSSSGTVTGSSQTEAKM